MYDPHRNQAEREHIYTERLGILCGADDPTPEQEAMARREADEWVRTLVEPKQRELL